MARSERLAWIVEQLGLLPHHRVLEIGPGHGVAATLVLDRLTTGTYTGVDCSSKMIAAAEQRNRDSVASGRARFVLAPFPTDALDGEQFDRIFAARVASMLEPDSVAAAERLLAPGGQLVVALDSPDGAHDPVVLRSGNRDGE